MKNKIIKVLMYGTLFAVFFMFFMYQTFPFDNLKKLIIHNLVKNSGAGIEELKIKTLKPYWLSGIEFEDLILKKSVGGVNSYDFNFDSGRIRVSILSILKTLWSAEIYKLKVDEQKLQKSALDNLQIKYDIEGYGGGALGHIVLSEPKHFKFEAGNIMLAKINFLSSLLDEAKLNGKLNAAGFNLGVPGGNINRATGNIILDLTNVSLENFKISFFPMPPLKISSLKVNIKAKKGKMQLNDFTIAGDIEGKIKGSIKLEPDIMYSQLNLSLSIKPSEKLLTNFKPLLNNLIKPDSSGIYNFRLAGSIGSPQVKDF